MNPLKKVVTVETRSLDHERPGGSVVGKKFRRNYVKSVIHCEVILWDSCMNVKPLLHKHKKRGDRESIHPEFLGLFSGPSRVYR